MTVFFWHEYEKNGYLSNWYQRGFEIDGVQYRHVEQYIMAQKAQLFGDTVQYEKIMQAEKPDVCKRYGRAVAPFEPAVWDYFRAGVLKQGLLAKFTQNDDLRQMLLATGDEGLAEASPTDRIFGIGMNAHEASKFSPAAWPGENLLGKTLMEVRTVLRRCPPGYRYSGN